MQQLSGQTALVTGASRGLGKGIALVLAENGADVVVNYHANTQEAEAVHAAIEALGRRCLVVKADVADADDVKAMFTAIDQQFGHLDILVNNAGTSRSEDIFTMTEDSWDFILDTNLKSMFLCAQAAMFRMRERRYGRIINISSVVGQQGALFGHVHYAATKSAILGFTKTLARTGAPLGITVNAIAPGVIRTELLFQTHGDAGVKKLADGIPLGLGEPRDVGLAAAFLAGEGGRYLTGICLDVNGGLYMRS